VNDQSAELAQWWTAFNDPVLNSLVEQAYQQNLTLRIAGLRILEARANLGIAIGSKYPQTQQINGGAAKVKISENEAGSLFADRRFETAEVTFDLAWERFRRLIESADANLDASIADYDDVMVALAAEVARTYVLIRTFEERLELVQGNVVTQQGALRIADVKFQNGAVTELDVQQARAVPRQYRSRSSLAGIRSATVQKCASGVVGFDAAEPGRSAQGPGADSRCAN
jgi:outer membrane protein TolC